MKKLLLSAVALTVLASACKKSDDNNSSSNTIKIGSTNYTVGIVQTLANTVIASGATTDNGTLTFTFPGTTLPVAGTYKVVSGTPAANQVSFSAGTSTGGNTAFYASTGAGTVNATVTISNSKIGISMPDAPATQITGGSATVNCSANFTQP